MLLWLQLVGGFALAQTNVSIEQLKNDYAKAPTDARRLELLEKMFGYFRPISVDSAQTILNTALPIARRSNNKKAEILFLTKQGVLYRMNKAEPKNALEVYFQALRIAESIQDSAAYSDVYYGIGRVQDEQRNYEEAERAFLSAIRWAKTGIAKYNAMESLAVHYANLKDLKRAEMTFLKVRDLVKELSPQLDNYQVRLNNNLGEFYAHFKGDTTQSLYYYKQATKYPATDPKVDLTRYLVEMESLATSFVSLKDYQNTIRYAQKVVPYRNFPKHNIRFTVVKAYRALFKAHQGLGNYRIATYYADSAKVLSDSLNAITNSDNIKKETYKLEAAFNLERKQKEVELLAAQQKAQQVWIVAIVVIALLLLVFSWVMYLNRQKLAVQKAELAALNTTKDKLFAILSHDLRSPIKSLGGYFMLINWGALSQAEFTESVKSLNTQLSNVHDMLENVLNWSLSQMNGMRPIIEKVKINPMIEEQIRPLKPVAKAKNIQLEYRVLPETQIMMDKNHLGVIVRNLLQNAIKFTHSGGKVSLTHYEKEDKLYIEVKDTGVGLSEEKRNKLFELEIDNSRLGTAQEKGTGLGLVLVKELVEANKGTIEVSSKINEGTTFLIGFRK